MAGIFGDDVNNRADFFRKLSEVTDACRRLIKRLPHEDTLQAVLAQLQAIEVWTAHGRTPTERERGSLDMALRMFREYEMTDDVEIFELRGGVSAVHSYVEHWPSDAIAADSDNDRYL
jgi:hypothetical protein